MQTIDYSDFATKLPLYLDDIEHNNTMVVIKRKSRKGVVIMPEKDYNSLIETANLLSSPANAKWLYESIRQMNNGHSREDK